MEMLEQLGGESFLVDKPEQNLSVPVEDGSVQLEEQPESVEAETMQWGEAETMQWGEAPVEMEYAQPDDQPQRSEMEAVQFEEQPQPVEMESMEVEAPVEVETFQTEEPQPTGFEQSEPMGFQQSEEPMGFQQSEEPMGFQQSEEPTEFQQSEELMQPVGMDLLQSEEPQRVETEPVQLEENGEAAETGDVTVEVPQIPTTQYLSDDEI